MSGVLGVVIMLQVTGHAGGVPKATLGRGRSIEFPSEGKCVWHYITNGEYITIYLLLCHFFEKQSPNMKLESKTIQIIYNLSRLLCLDQDIIIKKIAIRKYLTGRGSGSQNSG